ncbi:divalent-cation tolerance protein CutA [Saccharopolyspora sp. MS10]|uniref:divalent-cation tolerance protein CutA n=1 Tax=Saccharopolyspora sp. MS10 TaxID=3385973 RepID=UPI00399F1080
MADYVQVVTTTDSEEAAAELARGVVAARGGACAQVVPIRSFYRWEGQVRDDPEWQVQIKTTAARADFLIEHLRQHHSYEVPEIIVLPVVAGHDQYLAWLDEETRA